MYHAKRYLNIVEKKDNDYFLANNLKNTDCVSVTISENWVIVDIINYSLPKGIKDDIRAMFWI